MRRIIHLGIVATALALAAVTGQHAFAQGFTVKPMTMQVSPLPSQTLDLPLQIFNTAIDGPRTIDLRLVDLSQDEQGTWRLIESDSGVDLTGHASSLPWTTLSTKSVDIGPQQPASITIRLKPPADARGYYFAGIVAETPVPENPKGVVVRVRFLIPLIIEIRGRTVHERVAVSDVGMTYKKDTGAPPTTTAQMSIQNSGQTFSKVRGNITIARQNGTVWRVVTRLPINERGIIPGMTLKLGGDLERRLPSGTYQLRADLFVDGRRTAPLQKVVQFTGDPAASVAYDATLILQPRMVDMKVVPGATRTTVLHIENTSADPVKVKIDSTTPRGLIGVQMGQIVGLALSAQPWTQIQPSSFTLGPNGRQNVRVISSVPREGADQANYYADMVLKGTYADGQSAGETLSTVHLSNSEIKSDPKGSIEQVSLAAGDDSKYIAQLQFANIGNVDVAPSASLLLISPEGGAVASGELSGDPGPLLPLGKRTFSGELDLSNIRPGNYSLAAVVALAGDIKVTRKYTLAVTAEKFVSADGKSLDVPSVSLSDMPQDGASAAAGATVSSDTQVPLDTK